MLMSIVWAIVGGAMIGLSASLVLVGLGRIAGISGIVGSLIDGTGWGQAWRWWFFAGLVVGGIGLSFLWPESLQGPQGRPTWMIAVAGVLVGFGTRIGNGCTSGHGVCGLSRWSGRSLVATITFMAAGGACATLAGVWLRGLA